MAIENEIETERARIALSERLMWATSGMFDLYAAYLRERMGQVLGCELGGDGA